jgi:hypothetical protein
MELWFACIMRIARRVWHRRLEVSCVIFVHILIYFLVD